MVYREYFGHDIERNLFVWQAWWKSIKWIDGGKLILFVYRIVMFSAQG